MATDWSNGKGRGDADGWAKHKPMDDEEMLFKQVQMTTAATPGTTVWVRATRRARIINFSVVFLSLQRASEHSPVVGISQHRLRVPMVQRSTKDARGSGLRGLVHQIQVSRAVALTEVRLGQYKPVL